MRHPTYKGTEMAAIRSAVRPRRVPGRTPVAATGVRRHAATLRKIVGARRPLPWLAMVGVPLAATAALASDQWWALVPLGFCAWWWAPCDDPWGWLTATFLGIVGAAWVTVGTTALVTWPVRSGLILVLWIGVACALAVVSWLARRGGRAAT